MSMNSILRKRILLTAGGLFLLAGVGLLSYVGYTLVDGGEAVEENVVDLSGDSADDFLALPSPTATDIPATPAPTPAPPLGDQPYTITIDKIGVNAPVLTFGLDADQVPEVPLNASDVAWYDFSAKPGTGSNAVFAAHVTWNGRAVFYDLDDLTAGDQIALTSTTDGTQVVYSVSDVFSVDPDDPNSLKVMYGTEKDVITLITCGGTFTSNNDPTFGGEYSQRLVVRGNLVSVNRPAAQAIGGD